MSLEERFLKKYEELKKWIDFDRTPKIITKNEQERKVLIDLIKRLVRLGRELRKENTSIFLKHVSDYQVYLYRAFLEFRTKELADPEEEKFDPKILAKLKKEVLWTYNKAQDPKITYEETYCWLSAYLLTRSEIKFLFPIYFEKIPYDFESVWSTEKELHLMGVVHYKYHDKLKEYKEKLESKYKKFFNNLDRKKPETELEKKFEKELEKLESWIVFKKRYRLILRDKNNKKEFLENLKKLVCFAGEFRKKEFDNFCRSFGYSNYWLFINMASARFKLTGLINLSDEVKSERLESRVAEINHIDEKIFDPKIPWKMSSLLVDVRKTILQEVKFLHPQYYQNIMAELGKKEAELRIKEILDKKYSKEHCTGCGWRCSRMTSEWEHKPPDYHKEFLKELRKLRNYFRVNSETHFSEFRGNEGKLFDLLKGAMYWGGRLREWEPKKFLKYSEDYCNLLAKVPFEMLNPELEDNKYLREDRQSSLDSYRKEMQDLCKKIRNPNISVEEAKNWLYVYSIFMYEMRFYKYYCWLDLLEDGEKNYLELSKIVNRRVEED